MNPFEFGQAINPEDMRILAKTATESLADWMPAGPARMMMLTIACLSLLWGTSAQAAQLRVYVGTYTGGGSEGIYVADFDDESGAVSNLRLAAKVTNPSFLSVHPNKKFLYAVGEVGEFNGEKTGMVTAFAINPDGTLNKLNQQSSGGTGPCHLSVDPTGQAVLVANYGGGSVASIALEGDGKLGALVSKIQHEGSSTNPNRQKEPHAHCFMISKDSKFAYACDLGMDKVMVYELTVPGAAIKPASPAFTTVPGGSGPRHFAFHPTGQWAFAINELNCTMTVFARDPASGALTAKNHVTTLPVDFKDGYSTAEVVVHPSGKFVYGSNRGHHSIAVFAFNAETGELTPVGHTPTEGNTPRNFNLDPSGKYLFAANQDSKSVVVFKIDQATGKLTPTGTKFEVDKPVCVKFIAP